MKANTSNKQSESVHSSFPSSLKGRRKGSFFPSIEKSKSFFGPATLQPKLKIGQPDDRYEREADRVADTVMRMPDPQIQRQPVEEEEEELQMKRKNMLIQRKCEGCEEEEKLQKKSDSNLQSAKHAGSKISSQLASQSGTGRRLPKPVRSEMAYKMGADFSGVNIHTGPAAHELSNQLGARAFTHGSDIYFNKGEYNPASNHGKHLLAHELTHVVQQNVEKPSFLKPVIQHKEGNCSSEYMLTHVTETSPILQRSCGVSGIGDPRSQCQGQSGLAFGHRFLFRVNCDDLRNDTTPTQETALRSFVSGSITSGDEITIHGFASEDGGAEYNDKLSCARALRAREIIEHELSARGISASIKVFRHGEVSGDHERYRAAVLEVENEKPYSEDPSQIVFTPCNTLPKSLGSRGGCGSHSDFTYHDFPSLSTSDELIVAPYRLRSDSSLLGEMTSVLVATGGTEGFNATTRFAAGTGATHRFGPTHGMSIEAGGTPTFDAVRRATEVALNAAITAQASSGIIDCNTLTISVSSLPGISFPPGESLRLKAIIGGTQGLEVMLTSLIVDPVAHTYDAELRFIICDDFGVDHNDLYAPGLIPFWVLQHERSGYRPYIHELVIDETFHDSF